MKRFVLVASLIIFAGSLVNAQIKNPVKWTFTAKKINDKTYELHMTASIDPGWHIYTIDHSADIGVATTVTVNNNPLGAVSGKLKAVGKPVSMKDPSTGETVRFYERTVDLVQVVTLKASVKTSFTGSVEFMSCDDRQCLPPATKQFSISLQ